MEQMSSASLEKLLLLDFYSPEEGGADMDKLYHAARLLAQREPQPPVDRAWAAFQEKYLPFAPFGTSLYEDGSPPSSCAAPGRRRRWLRTALAAAALAATLLLFCAAAGANGYDLWGILARWTDEQLAIEPDQIVPIPKSDIHIPEEPEEYSSLQEALSACGLSQPLAPSWMPEGFELSALHVEDMSELGNVMFAALYARDDSHLTIFINVYFDTGQYSTSPSTHFQKDEGDSGGCNPYAHDQRGPARRCLGQRTRRVLCHRRHHHPGAEADHRLHLLRAVTDVRPNPYYKEPVF